MERVWTYRQFIVYDDDFVYPDFIVKYRRDFSAALNFWGPLLQRVSLICIKLRQLSTFTGTQRA